MPNGHTAPEWYGDGHPCPVDDCEGVWWRDVGGSAAYPKRELPSSCGHDIQSCANCGDKFAFSREGTAYSWPAIDHRGGPGTFREVYFCEECHTRENVLDKVPTSELRGLNERKLPGGSP